MQELLPNGIKHTYYSKSISDGIYKSKLNDYVYIATIKDYKLVELKQINIDVESLAIGCIETIIWSFEYDEYMSIYREYPELNKKELYRCDKHDPNNIYHVNFKNELNIMNIMKREISYATRL